jgi:proteasome activator subunit 4
MTSTDFVGSLLGPSGGDISRSSTPAGSWRDANGSTTDLVNGQGAEKTGRSRPRTYPYFKYLPYAAEPEAHAQDNLDVCIKNLYIAISAGDFNPGAVHWTREIRGWLVLKFEMPRETRIKLVKLYYELALAPGLDNLVAERFASMYMTLTKSVANFIVKHSTLTPD